ncbi:cytochrome c [Campylobacter sp. FMV-PI01]|uniref:Cytochrome c n=1 Tax=Campylobacter portucalensis TaxID=2608384 RepID=A0A6L5WJX5_9BACT|nr:cytochrome c [Campylobacter portucalensis]MSN96732.1 cytochrome c [Campylobacter portucalensis]
MKKVFVLLIVFIKFLFADSFITDVEYGKMLYKNPRGIGCNKCHGAKGEGGIIATYKELNKIDRKKYNKNLVAPAINELDPQEFADGVLKSNKIMPMYFLTKDEIIAIYKYLKISNKESKNDK